MSLAQFIRSMFCCYSNTISNVVFTSKCIDYLKTKFCAVVSFLKHNLLVSLLDTHSPQLKLQVIDVFNKFCTSQRKNQSYKIPAKQK